MTLTCFLAISGYCIALAACHALQAAGLPLFPRRYNTPAPLRRGTQKETTMLHDVILLEDHTHFRAYIQLADGERPDDVDTNAIAHRLREDADDIHVTSWNTIAEPNDWYDDYEYDLWQDALKEQATLWRLRGHIGDLKV